MNKLDAQQIFSSVLQLFKNEDSTNFERDYLEHLECHINSQSLNLEELRLQIINFAEHYQVLEIKVQDFIYENEKAGIRLYMKIESKEDKECLEDNIFFIYHFEDEKVRECWIITKLPVDKTKPIE